MSRSRATAVLPKFVVDHSLVLYNSRIPATLELPDEVFGIFHSHFRQIISVLVPKLLNGLVIVRVGHAPSMAFASAACSSVASRSCDRRLAMPGAPSTTAAPVRR